MKKTIRLSLCFCAIMLINSLYAQTEWCGTYTKIQQEIKNDTALFNRFEAFKGFQKQAQLNAAQNHNDRSTNSTIYIPVVFHIVHNGDALGTGENITDAQCLSQIDAMNLHYNFQDPDIANVPAAFQSLVANCNIKFCIAMFDPSGNPTTGIIRHQFSNATWDSMPQIDNILKPATIWDHTQYLNIWSVRMGGELAQQGVLAYSSFPFYTTADADGVTARYNTIGTTGTLLSGYVKGKTVTHEVGHWFGLLHVWGDDGGLCTGDPNGGQDYIDDTPDAADANFGCPTFPHVTCNNGPNGDMFMNYMDYSNDDCRNMFTNDQSDRMQFVLNGFRQAIKSASTICFFSLDAQVANIAMPADTICSLSFKPVVTLKSNGLTNLVSGNFYLQIDGGAPQTLGWTGSLATQATTQIAFPIQTVSAGAHTISVSFVSPNGQTVDNYTLNDNISKSFYAYDAGTSASAPFVEGFEGNFPPTNFNILNPNNDITWEVNTTSGGYGLSQNSAAINNKGYSANPNKKKDALITDIYDLSTIGYPELKFDVAYCRYSATRSDSLNLYYSLNCGSTWTKVWSQSGSVLATAPDQTTAFIPDGSQWKTVTVPLLAAAGQNKIAFKFENVTGWGNMLYLDNINLLNDPQLSITEVKRADVKIFPNPASQVVAVRLPFGHAFKQLQVLNTIGQVVYETKIDDTAIIFPVDNLSSGLYMIHLSGNNVSQTEKLIISK